MVPLTRNLKNDNPEIQERENFTENFTVKYWQKS